MKSLITALTYSVHVQAFYVCNGVPRDRHFIGKTAIFDIDIYLTTIGLAPGGGITRHIYNHTKPNLHRQKNFDSVVRALSLLSVIPWHSPNN